MGLKEVRWDKEGTVRAGDYNFFYWKGKENHQLGTGFFVHHRIVSAGKWVEFLSDRTPYIVLRGRWFNIIVLNIHYLLSDEILRYAYYSIISNYFSVYVLFCKWCNYKLHSYWQSQISGIFLLKVWKKMSIGGLHSREMGCCWLVCHLLRWYRIKWFCYHTWRSI